MVKPPQFLRHQLWLGLLIFMLAACDTTIKTDEAVIADAVDKKTTAYPSQIFAVDTASSEVTWIGSKMTGRHNGVIKLKTGELFMSNGLLTGGHFIMDVANTSSQDKTIDAESNKKLTTHLRSADFFDVEKHPTAAFELTGIARLDSVDEQPQASKSKPRAYSELRITNPTHRITGNLTIKGVTKSVSFPARVTLDTLLRAKANFNIDRTKWGLVYQSDKSLGDKTIYPEVNIGINLVAKPKED
ncbi:YceI family protein [Pontibacter sp. CAU 1760]